MQNRGRGAPPRTTHYSPPTTHSPSTLTRLRILPVTTEVYPPNLLTFKHSEAALKTLRPSDFPTHGIIAAHGISEYPERYRSLGTSATSPSATPHSVNGSAPARATARQRRTQTRNRVGRLPSGILEQRRRSLWPS